MKINNLVYTSDRRLQQIAVHQSTPDHRKGSTTFRKCTSTRSRHPKAQPNPASRSWKATKSSPFSSTRYSMNRAQISGSMVSRKPATLDRGSSTSSDWKVYARIWCYLQDRPTRRVHLKSDVLVLLKKPSGIFEDLVLIFLSQLLKIRHIRLEVSPHIALSFWLRLEASRRNVRI